jgi:hypothetical protein
MTAMETWRGGDIVDVCSCQLESCDEKREELSAWLRL